MAEFSIERNRNGKIIWYFLQSGSYKIIAQSWKEYDSVTECMDDILLLKDQINMAKVNDEVKPLQPHKKRKGLSIFGWTK